MTLLEMLKQSPTGISKEWINIFFSAIRESNKYVFETWSLDNYLQFLLQNQLIENLSNKNYKITQRGAAFWIYINTMNYPIKQL